jgi:restriction system protein
MILALATLGLGLVLLAVTFVLQLSHQRQRGAREAQAGLEVLRSLRWKEFANFVAQTFEARGYAIADAQRPPGEDGADLVLARGAERVLLQVKHGGSYHVGAGPVRALASMLAAQNAKAGVIATSGAFDAEATEAARGQSVTLLAGEPLWTALRDLLPQAMLAEAQEHAQALATTARTRLVSMAAIGAALTLAGAGLWLLLRMEGGELPAADIAPPTAAEAPRAAPALPTAAPAVATALPATPPAPTVVPAPTAPPVSDEDFAQQRDFAAAEALLVDGVASASWSSTSTLIVNLRGPLDEARRGEILRDVCARVVAREALRFTRLQVEMIGAVGETATPRWYPCR